MKKHIGHIVAISGYSENLRFSRFAAEAQETSIRKWRVIQNWLFQLTADNLLGNWWRGEGAVKSTSLPRGMYGCVVSPVVCCWWMIRNIRYQIPWYPGNYRQSYHTRRDDWHCSWKDLQVPDFAFDALQLVGTLWKRNPIEMYWLFPLHFCLTPESRVAQCKEAGWGVHLVHCYGLWTKTCTNHPHQFTLF